MTAQEQLNQLNEQLNIYQHTDYADKSMKHKYDRAVRSNNLANESELLDLEALCRIADALETIANRK